MFDGVLIDTVQNDALLFGVNDDAGPLVLIGDHELVAVFVDGDPVEGGIHLQDETALALAGGRIGGRVGVFGVGVEAADALLQGIANFNVHAATTCAGGNA